MALTLRVSPEGVAGGGAVERSGPVAIRTSRFEARRSLDGIIYSKNPVVVQRPVAHGKRYPQRLRFGEFCRSFLPERISKPLQDEPRAECHRAKQKVVP